MERKEKGTTRRNLVGRWVGGACCCCSRANGRHGPKAFGKRAKALRHSDAPGIFCRAGRRPPRGAQCPSDHSLVFACQAGRRHATGPEGTTWQQVALSNPAPIFFWASSCCPCMVHPPSKPFSPSPIFNPLSRAPRVTI